MEFTLSQYTYTGQKQELLNDIPDTLSLIKGWIAAKIKDFLAMTQK